MKENIQYVYLYYVYMNNSWLTASQPSASIFLRKPYISSRKLFEIAQKWVCERKYREHVHKKKEKDVYILSGIRQFNLVWNNRLGFICDRESCRFCTNRFQFILHNFRIRLLIFVPLFNRYLKKFDRISSFLKCLTFKK